VKYIVGILVGFWLAWYFPIEDEINAAFSETDNFITAVMDEMNVRKEDNSVSE